MAKVKGKLKADAYVGKRLRKAGEEVEVNEELAIFFFGETETETPKADKKPKE